ncbi:hypothetical protein NBRC111894_2800 [Sporolactobacillus inulinus]|uniref:Uncharacterized protein n=1 Tax=Sporolactobacillus inulinus TaxID=2078 RepID=A0A4Y1ZDQ2_9BACL|nr:hypothetical protein NBRC111894_2800 [Sporolactobacillus inulinus]
MSAKIKIHESKLHVWANEKTKKRKFIQTYIMRIYLLGFIVHYR